MHNVPKSHGTCIILFKQATLDRLSKLKITCSNYKALKVMDVLGENHNKVSNEARTWVTKEIH